jgi:MFS family permease
MALSTVAIGSLPTYDAGPYKAGIAASILLAVLRLVQGLAMGGEFGSAVIYVSELARPGRRGTFVAMLQLSAHAGMVLATLLVMALQNSLTECEDEGRRRL